VSDYANLLGVRDHDFLDVRRDHRCDRRRFFGRLDDDHVLLGEILCESFETRAAHVDAPRSFKLALVPGDRLGEARWISNPMIHMPASPSVFVQNRELSGVTTSTDPRSWRIRESRKGRPL
jgi:hypothetical protein